MRGTVVCGVTDSDEGRGAIEVGKKLSERLGMRLVLAHVVQGFYPHGTEEGNGTESVAMKGDRIHAKRLVTTLAKEYGVAESRSAVGDRAALLGQIAAEEAADIIVVGSSLGGWRRRSFHSTLAAELESITPVQVLIAPPRSRRPNQAGTGGGLES